MRWSRLLLAALLPACTAAPCAPPSTKPRPQDLGGITVDTQDRGIIFRRGEEELFHLKTAELRAGSATFDMEFGMFNIVETADPEWTVGSSIDGFLASNTSVVFTLHSGGSSLAAVNVTSPSANHLLVTIKSARNGLTRSRITFGCREDDHFNGLGAQTHDVDHRGQKVPLWVSEQGIGKTDTNDLPEFWQLTGRRHSSHIPMPAVVTSRNTAWLLDTSAYSVFDLCSEGGTGSLEAWEPELRFHLFVGNTPLEALQRLSDHVGRPPLPAPWVFAPWNDAIFGTDNVRAFANFLRDNNIPSSAIWTEDWKGGEWNGSQYRLSEDWTLDETLYPGFADLVSELRGKGIAMQMYFNTFIYQEADIYDEAERDGHMVLDVNGEPWVTTGAKFTDTGFADLTRPETRAWVKTFLRRLIDEYGALGWMADFAEWMPVQGARLASGEDPALVHNRYPVLWQELNEEVMQESGKRDEMIVYYRSGHIGSQRLAQVMWAGDQRTDFQHDDGLPTIIPIGLGLSATGFLFYAHDIAGYQSATNPPATRELFYRWTTLGALSPVMRTHHGTHAQQNWNLTSDPETTAHYRRWANFHIQLYPYLRALAHTAVDSGIPLWIPMGLLHGGDGNTWSIMDQFYLGTALLVAPVVTEGATSRQVYLPAGRFVPLLGGEAITGPTTITVDAPLTEIPMFIAAGGIVPMTAEPAMTLLPNVQGIPGLESTEGDRVVFVGLGRDSTFSEESGATYTLTGTGTDTSGLTLEDDGSVLVTGNGTVQGGGFTLELSGHPADRVTRVFLR